MVIGKPSHLILSDAVNDHLYSAAFRPLHRAISAHGAPSLVDSLPDDIEYDKLLACPFGTRRLDLPKLYINVEREKARRLSEPDPGCPAVSSYIAAPTEIQRQFWLKPTSLSSSVMLPVVVVATVLVLVVLASRRRRRLPPGPKPSPIVGNLLQIPINRPWIQYHEWFNAYSEFSLSAYFNYTD